jgi:hypothetical protein
VVAMNDGPHLTFYFLKCKHSNLFLSHIPTGNLQIICNNDDGGGGKKSTLQFKTHYITVSYNDLSRRYSLFALKYIFYISQATLVDNNERHIPITFSQENIKELANLYCILGNIRILNYFSRFQYNSMIPFKGKLIVKLITKEGQTTMLQFNAKKIIYHYKIYNLQDPTIKKSILTYISSWCPHLSSQQLQERYIQFLNLLLKTEHFYRDRLNEPILSGFKYANNHKLLLEIINKKYARSTSLKKGFFFVSYFKKATQYMTTTNDLKASILQSTLSQQQYRPLSFSYPGLTTSGDYDTNKQNNNNSNNTNNNSSNLTTTGYDNTSSLFNPTSFILSSNKSITRTARKHLPDDIGFICPILTSPNEHVGMSKVLAENACFSDTYNFDDVLQEIVNNRIIITNTGKNKKESDTTSKTYFDIYIGLIFIRRIICSSKNPLSFYLYLKTKFPHISCRWFNNVICLDITGGRIISQHEITFMRDPTTMIATTTLFVSSEELRILKAHNIIFSSYAPSFHPIISLIPALYHNPQIRAVSGTHMLQQTINFSYNTANYIQQLKASCLVRFDNPFLKKESKFYDMIQGELPLTWIGHVGGYNQEDAIVVNESAVRRGMFQYFSTKTLTYGLQYKIPIISVEEEIRSMFQLPTLATVQRVYSCLITPLVYMEMIMNLPNVFIIPNREYNQIQQIIQENMKDINPRTGFLSTNEVILVSENTKILTLFLIECQIIDINYEHENNNGVENYKHSLGLKRFIKCKAHYMWNDFEANIPSILHTSLFTENNIITTYSRFQKCLLQIEKQYNQQKKKQQRQPPGGISTTVAAAANEIVRISSSPVLKQIQLIVLSLNNLTVGNKLTTFSGQKGIVGAFIPETELPFDEAGLTPDIIISPLCFPSRMTYGLIRELLDCKNFRPAHPYGKYFMGGSKFSEIIHNNSNDRVLTYKSGYQATGAFLAPLFYVLLSQLPQHKIYASPRWAKINPFTGDYRAGKAAEGGLRFGRMESEVFLAQGASHIYLSSDTKNYHPVYVCKLCSRIIDVLPCYCVATVTVAMKQDDNNNSDDGDDVGGGEDKTSTTITTSTTAAAVSSSFSKDLSSSAAAAAATLIYIPYKTYILLKILETRYIETVINLK